MGQDDTYNAWAHLHSTMVLFKFKGISKSYKADLFTFHYGPIQIRVWWNIKTCVMQFTFHYGPIQIFKFYIFIKSVLLFTFHYGPIQIVKDIDLEARTM